MSTSERADLHRMATKIALSYARCHNEAFDAFPTLFRTAYHGLLSCTEQGQQDPVRPSQKTMAPSRPVAQPKPMAQSRQKASVKAVAPAKASAQRTPTSGANRSWTTWASTGKKPGRPPKNGAGSKNGAGRYR